MSTGLAEALKLLGFGTPCVYAAATYSFFHFLDKRASGAAKKALSGWIGSSAYDRTAAADAMVEMFDRLYTRPLLGWRAFIRSSIITLVVTGIFVYEMFWSVILMMPPDTASSDPSTTELRRFVAVFYIPLIAASIVTNVLSDYASLFVIRRWLIVGRARPLFSLLTGPIVGAFVIVMLIMFRDVLWFIYNFGTLPDFPTWWSIMYASTSITGRSPIVLTLPALVVHLWLPLFGLGVFGVRALNALLAATRKMQWLLKQGERHPLEAIGYIAAALIFIGSGIVRWMVR